MEIREIRGLKTLFAHAKYEIKLDQDLLDKLNIQEKRIGIVSNIQTADVLEKIKEYLEKKNHKVIIAGQIVGCNASRALAVKNDVDAFLFVGSGMFHPLELIEKTKIKHYYHLNPIMKTFSKLDEQELINMDKRKQAKLAKYYNSNRIGILVSTKPGQEELRLAKRFAETCEKEAYIFIDNHLNIEKLEDFPDIEYWVNTACPRLEFPGIISLKDILGVATLSTKHPKKEDR
jgi:2-(3-amino-3-carboxypropyl)histidine synthase